jgi:hypothetical protein
MGAQGTTEVDFGSFPGKSDASIDVTGQGSITGTSLVEAWIFPATTTDHSADEHMLETIKVFAGNISAGVGFTIYAFNTSQLNEPLVPRGAGRAATTVVGAQASDATPRIGGKGTRLYGKFKVAWVWN